MCSVQHSSTAAMTLQYGYGGDFRHVAYLLDHMHRNLPIKDMA